MPTLSLGVLLIFRQSSGPVGRRPERFQDGRTGADKDLHLQFLLPPGTAGRGSKPSTLIQWIRRAIVVIRRDGLFPDEIPPYTTYDFPHVLCHAAT
jgi:hypothetical protein